ncbi:hypothetical protein BDK51DRAFT_50155 [Blyttiomyces helicus]|uniref:Uncharacterized protein n=1 Tax=Blyttiomyces helicus TaxID=388810 RepID=A0A4P9VUG1_9FUNG|nr:hypothetical protein BDK51DRAFT_50155 [Blyttiomyces helicus]|eukprot:RKO83229.1 hypothetical protein BDK51DRAFT_50155 [Blyttiomyces helicus]
MLVVKVTSKISARIAELHAAGAPPPLDGNMPAKPRPLGRVSGGFYANHTSQRVVAEPKVFMSDDESGSDDMDIDPQLKNTAEYKELRKLKKLARINGDGAIPSSHAADPVHHGFKCDRCQTEPIVGVNATSSGPLPFDLDGARETLAGHPDGV